MYWNMTIQYCTRDFTEMYCELHGISYPSGIAPLPSDRRVRSEGIRMAFSNIDRESADGILKFEALASLSFHRSHTP